MIGNTLTLSVGIAQILEEFRSIVRQELAALQQFHTTASTEAVGGVDLAVEVTRLSKSRVYALVQKRAIPHSKRGNKLYFNRADLLAWVEKGKRQEK